MLIGEGSVERWRLDYEDSKKYNALVAGLSANEDASDIDPSDYESSYDMDGDLEDAIAQARMIEAREESTVRIFERINIGVITPDPESYPWYQQLDWDVVFRGDVTNGEFTPES